MDEAIRPTSFNIPSFAPLADKEGLSEEEQVLAAGSKTKFWKVLKDYLDQVVKELDQVNEQAIAQGASMEQIGQNTIVIAQVKSVVRKAFNVVDDAIETVERVRNEK